MYLYNEEYYEEAMKEMYKYLREAEKEGVFKDNYYFQENLQKAYISESLSNSGIRDDIVAFVGTFIDDHYNQLSTSGPVYTFTFSEKEANVLYNLFNITGEKIIELYNNMVNETYYGKISKFFTGWVTNAPHRVLIISMLIDALQNNYEDMILCCEYMMAFIEYPVYYRLFWKTGVREDVMNYTIEHLGSKFKIKKVNNLQGLLEYDAKSAVESFRERLLTGADNVYMDFMQRIINQIKNTLKNISTNYYEDIKNNASQHNSTTQFDDGSFADQEGLNSNIGQIVDKTINKFSNSGINNSLIRVCAEGVKGVSKDNLTEYVNMIWSSKNNKLPKMVEVIITAYFNRNPTSNSVGSSEFINYGLALYRSINNSKDPLYVQMSEILDYWVNDIIHIQDYYQRPNTIVIYKRALFNYIIFLIAHYNN